MKPAESLIARIDPALRSRPASAMESLAVSSPPSHFRAIRVDRIPGRRSAARETSVQRVFILARAGFTHLEARMVVLGRSYGISEMMVKRGPQFVQLVNGYRKRRSLGSKSSRLQSVQVTMSGEMS